MDLIVSDVSDQIRFIRIKNHRNVIIDKTDGYYSNLSEVRGEQSLITYVGVSLFVGDLLKKHHFEVRFLNDRRENTKHFHHGCDLIVVFGGGKRPQYKRYLILRRLPIVSIAFVYWPGGSRGPFRIEMSILAFYECITIKIECSSRYTTYLYV